MQCFPIASVDQFETYAEGVDHSECIAFDSEGVLWAGGEAGQVYRVERQNQVKEITNIGGLCLGLAFSQRDDLYICNPKLGAIIKVEKSGKSSVFADFAGRHKLVVPNYGVFASDGTFYASDSGKWHGNDGVVVRYRPNGKGEVFAEPFSFSNGLALSADERFLYVVESNKDAVARVEIRSDGSAGEVNTYATGLARVPDGLALDEQGGLFVSCYASDNIYRITDIGEVCLFAYDPEGTILARPTNVAFGGPNRDELYVANLGRWHINRVRTSFVGQRLVNQISGTASAACLINRSI